ncbi:sensor histidine kinase [Marmoricola sp. Leaf446]|uniref:MadS family sensor histidine kinase n=1 Tax=Marmoricola sp. Leaf446 TaxID=1736379 RepID=UPI0009E9578E|nr:histidine kinase [Marmoricola sp. Leaf446]
MTPARPRRSRPDLARLTGVRSGKGSYYRAYVASDERVQRAVVAMDSISRALVRTVEGPRGLLEEVLRAAAAHLDAHWTLLALADDSLTGARPRFLACGTDGVVVDDARSLPADLREVLAALRTGRHPEARDDDAWVWVPMTLDGRRIGSLVARHGLEAPPEAGDLSVLRILANQAAVSLHTSEQYQAGLTLHRRAQQLYDEATAQSRDLAVRTEELRATQERLQVARQRELLDTERHRIARELHDSVAQYVLSAGMSVEIARGDAEALGDPAASVVAALATAKTLSGEAVEQLRRAIFALHQPHGEEVATLPELAREVAAHHRGRLEVSVRTHGRVRPLQAHADHELARAIGEALFNVVSHAGARRAAVLLRYRDDELLVSVSDDGSGDPSALRRLLELERCGTADGRHRGLANIESRIVDLGGGLAFRRARIGGIRVELRLPLDPDETDAVVPAGATVTELGRTPRPSPPHEEVS